MDYKDIIGHEEIIETLKKSIENNNVNHSYLFEGEEGIGKKMVAYAFSKTLLCKEKGLEPCNNCISCFKFDNCSHPDFHIIESDKGLIRIDVVRDLIREMSTSPFESDKKIFVIDNSDLIHITGQNAILKTLEEPPNYVNLILISSKPNNLLSTILSRVQNIKFYPIKPNRVMEYLLKRYNLNEEKARFITELTKGGIGKSKELIEKEDFFEIRDWIIKTIVSLSNGDKSKVYSSMEFFEKYKDSIDDILDIIIYWFRDLIIYKEIGESPLIINQDKILELSEHSYMNFNKINDIIGRVEETKLNIKRNINYQLVIETMLLNV